MGSNKILTKSVALLTDHWAVAVVQKETRKAAERKMTSAKVKVMLNEL